MYDASNTRHIREAQRAAKVAEGSRGRVILTLMSNPEGRTFIHDFLGRCNVFHTPFTGVASGTDFNCGKQSVGLELIAEVVRWAPDQYIQMMREAQDREAGNERRSNNPNSGRIGNSEDDGRDPGDAGRIDSDYDPSPDDPE